VYDSGDVRLWEVARFNKVVRCSVLLPHNLNVCVSVCLYVCVCMSVCLSVCLYVCVCMSVCLSVCLCVCV